MTWRKKLSGARELVVAITSSRRSNSSRQSKNLFPGAVRSMVVNQFRKVGKGSVFSSSRSGWGKVRFREVRTESIICCTKDLATPGRVIASAIP